MMESDNEIDAVLAQVSESGLAVDINQPSGNPTAKTKCSCQNRDIPQSRGSNQQSISVVGTPSIVGRTPSEVKTQSKSVKTDSQMVDPVTQSIRKPMESDRSSSSDQTDPVSIQHDQTLIANPSLSLTKQLMKVNIFSEKRQYMHQVFPKHGKKPIISCTERTNHGLYSLYQTSLSDMTVLKADEHWCMYDSRDDIPQKYRNRVIKWLTYYIGAIPYNVAICKYTLISALVETK